MTFDNITTFITTIIALALGTGGLKMLDRLLKYKEISNKTGSEMLRINKQDKQDGWEIAIKTLRDELSQERDRRKEDGQRFYKMEADFRVEIQELTTKVNETEKQVMSLKNIIVSQGLGHLIEQSKVNQAKLDKIKIAVEKKPKKTKKEKMPD